jgi:hypothetical protein
VVHAEGRHAGRPVEVRRDSADKVEVRSVEGQDVQPLVAPVRETPAVHVDAYGRSFIPLAIPSTVAILDTNGNRICEVGKYGNLDDPPNLATNKEPIKGSDIRVAWCMRVGSFPDKWLYIVDDGNMRIVRVKLGYRAEERVPLP